MLKIIKLVTILVTGFLIVLQSNNTSAAVFIISGYPATDSVQFASTAKLEFIEGNNNDISGYFSFPPESIEGVPIGIIKVDLRTLKTGIETRDEHMRDRHLQTETYPFAYFELVMIPEMPQTIVKDSLYSVLGVGYFYIHGNKRKLEAPIEFILLDNNRLRVSAEFSLKLDEYKIPRPKALFLKLAETIKIRVVFQATEGELKEPVNLPEYKLLE